MNEQRRVVEMEQNSGSLFTVAEAAEQLRISKGLAYELVARGQMPHVRLGRLIRIPRQALENWLECHETLTSGDDSVLDFPAHRSQEH
jgi:excisionase family DNA binding protein